VKPRGVLADESNDGSSISEGQLHREEGFTLVELMVVISLSAILLTLSASALRTYWLTQALDTSGQDVVTQFRQLQQRTDSYGHPLVYGARFDVGTSDWATVRYDPKDATVATDDVCEITTQQVFPDGVTISAADFEAPPGVQVSKCAGSNQKFVFFYARGTATGGSVTLTHPITGKTRTITVLPLTGRARLS
jgi:prepilin-type N-terminal cleavage/methylation domain-containing protein